ncbi:MAG: ACT domain-containing protein, partial [Endomicrobium sp.]|nr:ACT domain-containing protein [Endomicrobium sp.]
YDKKTKIKILPAGKSKASYYLRFNVIDKPGVLAKISGILGKYRVSIASLSQPDMEEDGNCITQIIITTHITNRENLEKALKQIDATKSIVKSKTVKIKIER